MLLFVVLLVGTVVVTLAGSLLLPGRGGRGRRAARGLVAAVATYGGVTLLAHLAVNSGGQGLVGPDAEWPVGHATGVVRDSAGRYIVPHRQVGRVQVYDPDLRFERGWFVETDGGAWKVRVGEGDRVEVFTARGRQRRVYTPSGELVEQDTFDPEGYADIPTGPTVAMDVGTPWVLRPFAHPLYGVGLAVLGVLGLSALHRIGHRPAPPNPPLQPTGPAAAGSAGRRFCSRPGG